MQWYYYVMWFFGGIFLANFVPHFTRGISGATFPTPFAKPPGRGLSGPTVNVLWGLANLAVAYVLLRYGHFSLMSWRAVIVVFVGVLAIGIQLSRVFSAIHSKGR